MNDETTIQTPKDKPSKPPRSLARRALVTGSIGGLTLVGGLLITVMLLLNTDAGLSIVRSIAVAYSGNFLTGHLEVGAIRGSVLSTLTIDDVTLTDDKGQPAIQAERLELEWRPSALADGEIEVQRLVLNKPRVAMVQTASDGLNLARLVPPSDSPKEPKPASEPLPLSLPKIRVISVVIRDGHLTYTANGKRLATVEDLDVDLNARIDGPRIEAHLPRFTARVQDGLPLSLKLSALLDGKTVTVNGLRLEVDDGRVEVPSLVTEIPPGPLDGEVEIDVPPFLVHRLGGPEQLLAGVDLQLRARRAADAPRWTADLKGHLGPSPLSLSATVTESLDEIAATVVARTIDPSALWRGLPEGRLDLDLLAEGDVTAPDVRANLLLQGTLRPDPSFPPVPANPLKVQARWQGDAASAKAKGRIAKTRINVDAAIDRLDQSTPRITRGEVQLTIPELRDLVGRVASGEVILSASASGPVDQLAASGQLEARRVASGPQIRIRKVSGKWDVKGLPAAPVGRLNLDVRQVKLPGRSVEGLALDVRAQTEQGKVELSIPKLRLKTGPLTWVGQKARFTRNPNGAMSLSNFNLRSKAGSIELSAEVGAGGPAAGDFEAQANLQDLDIRQIPRSLVPELNTISGRVGLSVDASKRKGRTRAELKGRLGGFRLEEGRPPIDGNLQVDLQPGQAVANVELRGLGDRVSVNAKAPAPRDATDPAGWNRALRGGPLERLDLSIDRLDLTRVFALIGQPPAVRGLVNITANLLDKGKAAAVDIRAPSLKFDPPLEKAQAGITTHVRFANARLGVSGRIDGSAIGEGTFSATVAGPRGLFDAEGWAKLDETAVQAASIDFDALQLAALDELGLVSDLSGTLTARVRAGRAARRLVGQVVAESVRTPWIEGSWDSRLDALVTSTVTRSALTVALDRNRVIVAEVSAPLPLKDIIQGKTEQLNAVPIDAKVDIQDLTLARVAKAGGLDTSSVERGHLESQLRASGSSGDMNGQLAFAIRDIIIAGRKYKDLTIDANYKNKALTLRTEFVAPGAGGLAVTATGSFASEQPAIRAHLNGFGLPIRFLSRLGLVPVGLGGQMYADLDVEFVDGKLSQNGWLEVKPLRLVFAQAALQPWHSGLLRLDVDPTSARLKLDAKSLSGEITARANADLTVPTEPKLKADARLKEFPINAGQLALIDLKVKVDGDVHPQDGTKMNVELFDGYVVLADQSTRKLHSVSHPSEVEFVDRLKAGAPSNEKKKKKKLGPPVVVSVKARSPIRVRGEKMVNASIDMAIASRSNVPNEPGVRGRIWVPEGTVTLVDREYRIDRAEIILEGRDPPDPRLNILLSHEFTDDGVTFLVRVTGNASAPNVEFASSPARFSQPELLQIFSGTAPSELGTSDGRRLEDQAAGAAVGFLAGQLQKEIGRAVPLDTLEVDVTEQGISNFTLGKWITKEVFLAYRQNFEATQLENDYEAVVQYRFLPGWMVELVAGLQRNELDLLWLRRF